MNVTWIDKKEAPKLWPLVEPFLISALKRWLPVYFSCDLLEMVMNDELQLWVITNNKEERLYGAALTEVRKYPRAKIMNIFMLGGKDLKLWRDDMEAAMDVFARSQGCDFMQATGRRGWLCFRGAFESAVVMNKVLT